MNDPRPNELRLLDLLALQALFELTAAEQQELELLLRSVDLDRDVFERVAGVAVIAMNPLPESNLPVSLQKKILDAAPAILAETRVQRGRADAAPGLRTNDDDELLDLRMNERRWRGMLGWVAAAVCLMLMFINRPVAPSPVPTLAESRTHLIKFEPGTIQCSWIPTGDLAAVEASGDVVWNTLRQEGYATFRGLPMQNPSQSQYQLWLFDIDQDERYPISAGVFDFDPTNGTCMVPLKSSVHVHGPKLFALTLERAGGVVVSNRNRLLLTATPGTSRG